MEHTDMVSSVENQATQAGRKATSVVRRVQTLIVDIEGATASTSENGE